LLGTKSSLSGLIGQATGIPHHILTGFERLDSQPAWRSGCRGRQREQQLGLKTWPIAFWVYLTL
jgi:hypothetical protein